MDRIDAIRVFVVAVDEGSLAGAARRLGKSPTAVSRALAFLETRVGAELLHRTTRAIRLSEAGERYVVACRQILAELEEADRLAAGQRAEPHGLLTLSCGLLSGERVLRPIINEFLGAYPKVSARLLLLNRFNLVEEGIDIAFRVGELPDSSLVATRIGGDLRVVVIASPDYLARHPPIAEPGDLAGHDIIALSEHGLESWSFTPARGSTIPRTVRFTPRLAVNTVRAALASAIAGRGLTRLYSFNAAQAVRDGRVRVVLADAEHPRLPIHMVAPPGRLSLPKVRAFWDFAKPRLRAEFATRADIDAKALG